MAGFGGRFSGYLGEFEGLRHGSQNATAELLIPTGRAPARTPNRRRDSYRITLGMNLP